MLSAAVPALSVHPCGWLRTPQNLTCASLPSILCVQVQRPLLTVYAHGDCIGSQDNYVVVWPNPVCLQVGAGPSTTQ